MPTYKYKIEQHKLTGSMSIAPLESNITISPVQVQLRMDPMKLTTLLIGDPDRPVTTDSSLTINNLPTLSKQDIKDLLTPEVRMRIPNYNKVCFNFMGVEFFKICLSGESQVITEPYVPNAYERCEVPCCEPDLRPFPGDTYKPRNEE